ISTLLSIKRSGSHRDLHSFPTRRSSDLAEHVDDTGTTRSRACAYSYAARVRDRMACDQRPRTPLKRTFRICPAQPYLSPLRAHRSEEHTSELQSRENLVCRLLLEKKKKV